MPKNNFVNYFVYYDEHLSCLSVLFSSQIAVHQKEIVIIFEIRLPVVANLKAFVTNTDCHVRIICEAF